MTSSNGHQRPKVTERRPVTWQDVRDALYDNAVDVEESGHEMIDNLKAWREAKRKFKTAYHLANRRYADTTPADQRVSKTTLDAKVQAAQKDLDDAEVLYERAKAEMFRHKEVTSMLQSIGNWAKDNFDAQVRVQPK